MESNKGLEDKTMFDEMRETGSNIPDKVKYLQEHGWQSYKHHDNWVKKDLKDWEKDLCNFDLNSAYEECLRKENELSNAIEVLCNALREDTSEGSYYYSLQANIAMQFKDEFWKTYRSMSRYYVDFEDKMLVDEDKIHEISNEAAKNFLNLLIKK